MFLVLASVGTYFTVSYFINNSIPSDNSQIFYSYIDGYKSLRLKGQLIYYNETAGDLYAPMDNSAKITRKIFQNGRYTNLTVTFNDKSYLDWQYSSQLDSSHLTWSDLTTNSGDYANWCTIKNISSKFYEKPSMQILQPGLYECTINDSMQRTNMTFFLEMFEILYDQLK